MSLASFLRRVRAALRPALGIAAVLTLGAVLFVLAGDGVEAQMQALPLGSAVALLVVVCALAYVSQAARRQEISNDAVRIMAVIVVLLAGGFLLAGAAEVIAAPRLAGAASRSAMLWAAACFMAGFLAGFLFGVPKVDGARAEDGRADGRRGRFSQLQNTNLEQISDWLTKIIVGVGLVELRTLPEHLKRAAGWVAQSLTGTSAAEPAAVSFAGSLIVYFSTLGFLAGYLLTMLYLAGAFGRAGQQAYGDSPSRFGDDRESERIREFWRPGGGPPNPANTKQLSEWIDKNLPAGTGITELLSAKELDAQRRKVIADLRIP